MSDMWFRHRLFLMHGGKISYFDCHRRWLSQKHDFRQEQNTFQNDTTITKGLSKHLRGTQIVDMLDKLTPDPERLDYFEGYGETHSWTHKCIMIIHTNTNCCTCLSCLQLMGRHHI
jgi:hypothetical protein